MRWGFCLFGFFTIAFDIGKRKKPVEVVFSWFCLLMLLDLRREKENETTDVA